MIDESLQPFLYVIKEVGGWCCPSCTISNVLPELKPRSKASSISQQNILDNLNRELTKKNEY